MGDGYTDQDGNPVSGMPRNEVERLAGGEAKKAPVFRCEDCQRPMPSEYLRCDNCKGQAEKTATGKCDKCPQKATHVVMGTHKVFRMCDDCDWENQLQW